MDPFAFLSSAITHHYAVHVRVVHLHDILGLLTALHFLPTRPAQAQT